MNTDTHKLLVGAIRTLVNITKRTAEPEKPKHAPQMAPPRESGMQDGGERSRRKQEIRTRFGF